MESSESQIKAPRGLATVAMLKVNFDAGHDHIAMFEPFVLDAVGTLGRDDMTDRDIRSALKARDELTLPLNTLQTLLGRLVKSGLLRREGGRYFRTEQQIEVPDICEERAAAEGRQQKLATALREMAGKHGVAVASDEDALALILKFFDRHHVLLAFDQAPVIDEAESAKEHEDPGETVTAMFLRDTISGGGDLAEILQEMLEGYVLQNTLLLRDISTAERGFKNLHVVIDSQLLFAALGMRGAALETATVELLNLLRDTGAVTDVFEPTIREMRRILAVYEEKIRTPQGRSELHQTDLTRFFLSRRCTAGDIKQYAALLEPKLKQLKFNIREPPTREEQWTLGEQALGTALAGEDGSDREPRVVHDCDCIAGVLSYRKGKTSDSLDNATAVFVTSSGMTTNTVREWYREEGGQGFPPIIHVLGLSNFAWLKKPASASKLKVHELVALCGAALRPSSKTWQRFLNHLKKLEQSGELSTDEVTAIVASGLTENALVENQIDQDSDAESLAEVVDRVKAEYREQNASELAKANRIERSLTNRTGLIARSISWVIVVGLGLWLAAGSIWNLVLVATGDTPSILVVALLLAPLAVLGGLGLWNGFHLKGMRGRLEASIWQRLKVWFADAPPN
jgi:predicted transcriptional regulator